MKNVLLSSALLLLLCEATIAQQSEKKPAECPMGFTSKSAPVVEPYTKANTNENWWPNQLNL